MIPWGYLGLIVLGVALFYGANETLIKISTPAGSYSGVGGSLQANHLPQNGLELMLTYANFMGLFMAVMGLAGALNLMRGARYTLFPAHLVKMWLGLNGNETLGFKEYVKAVVKNVKTLSL